MGEISAILSTFLVGQAIGQRLDKRPNRVPHPAIRRQTLLFAPGRCRQARRIVESDVNDLGPSRKHRARLAGIIANRHHIIKRKSPKLADQL